jgi:hypothetical protein
LSRLISSKAINRKTIQAVLRSSKRPTGIKQGSVASEDREAPKRGVMVKPQYWMAVKYAM